MVSHIYIEWENNVDGSPRPLTWQVLCDKKNNPRWIEFIARTRMRFVSHLIAALMLRKQPLLFGSWTTPDLLNRYELSIEHLDQYNNLNNAPDRDLNSLSSIDMDHRKGDDSGNCEDSEAKVERVRRSSTIESSARSQLFASLPPLKQTIKKLPVPYQSPFVRLPDVWIRPVHRYEVPKEPKKPIHSIKPGLLSDMLSDSSLYAILPSSPLPIDPPSYSQIMKEYDINKHQYDHTLARLRWRYFVTAVAYHRCFRFIEIKENIIIERK